MIRLRRTARCASCRAGLRQEGGLYKGEVCLVDGCPTHHLSAVAHFARPILLVERHRTHAELFLEALELPDTLAQTLLGVGAFQRLDRSFEFKFRKFLGVAERDSCHSCSFPNFLPWQEQTRQLPPAWEKREKRKSGCSPSPAPRPGKTAAPSFLSSPQ